MHPPLEQEMPPVKKAFAAHHLTVVLAFHAKP